MNFAKYIFLMMLFMSIGSSTEIVLYKGVLDRIENDHAVILIETIDQELVLSKDLLPLEIPTHTWVNIEFIDHTFKVISIDHPLTEKRKRKSTYMINKLRENTEPK